MKKIYFVLVLMAISIYCCAQVQQGYVKTVGKKGLRGTPLNGVLLKTSYTKSSPVVSSSNGTFSLPISGNKFQMSKIQKNNYRLADDDVIGREYSYTPSSPVVFAMVSLEEYRKSQRAIEERALNKYERIFSEKAKRLEEELERKKISNDEYARRIEELEEENSSFQKMISKLSDRYARTDYDDIDSLDMLINQYIEEGEYDMAATLVDSKGDIRKRIADTKEREKNAAILRSIAEKESQSAEREKQSIINDLGVKIQIARSKIQQDSVQYWIECRADYDSTNIEYQMETVSNLLEYAYPNTEEGRKALWKHIDNNRRYIYRALDYLKNSGNEYSTETLKCLSLLNYTYRNESGLTGRFVTREAMELADRMIEIERKSGMPPIEGLSVFYSNMSFLVYLSGKDSQTFTKYYQKSLDEKYEAYALQLYKDVENTNSLLSLYFDMKNCISEINKCKEIDKIRLNLYLKIQDGDALNTVMAARIYRELGEQKKAIQYLKSQVLGFEKQNELANSIDSRNNLLQLYIIYVDCLENAGDYKSMCEYSWRLYELDRMTNERFSTYRSRFECAKNLQKHIRASILSKRFSNVEEKIVESFKLAEEASNFRQMEYSEFIFRNYIYLSQVYAYKCNYSLALSAIAKARGMYPDDEEAKNVEVIIKKKARK